MAKKAKTRSKTFEFLTLLLMVIGTTVGGGIYMKNKEVLSQTQNPIIDIILWVIVGSICVMSLIMFMEISSSTKYQGNGTVGNWTKLFVNRKTASFFSLLFMIIYMPAINTLFVGSMIYYFMAMILAADGHTLSAGAQLGVYIGTGILMTAFFAMLNALKQNWSKGLQVFGTIFKFIPLLIAFIGGFVMIQKVGGSTGDVNVDDRPTVFFQGNFSWKPTNFLRGFGGILLAFDGYVYLANSQKDAVHKEVVPAALITGLAFVAVFYVLMAISLFCGSTDGSIVNLFQRIFGKKHINSKAAMIITDLIMAIICFLSSDVMIMILVVQIDSDAAAKLIYTGKKRTKVSQYKCAWVSILTISIVYVIIFLMGFFIPVAREVSSGVWESRTGWDIVNNTPLKAGESISNAPMIFVDILSSVGSILSFVMVTTVLYGGVVNRWTNKVKVEKKRGALTCGLISAIFLTLFIILGIYTFLDPNNGDYSKTSWAGTSALPFLIFMIAAAAILLIAFFIQEALFKKYPFKGGFDGQLEIEDTRPWMFEFHPIQNYVKSNNKSKTKRR